MRAVLFDLDHTIFNAQGALHDGAKELLAILKQLGLQIAGLTQGDHRVLVRLDEAGIREYFASVLCADHVPQPKMASSVHHLLGKVDSEPAEAVLVSRAYSDIALGRKAGLTKTIAVTHGSRNTKLLNRADHVVPDMPSVLDVIG